MTARTLRPQGIDGDAFSSWVDNLQERLCADMEGIEAEGGAWGPTEDGHQPLEPPPARFVRDAWTRPASDGKLAGRGLSAVLEGGRVFERAAVLVSDVRGARLPPAASVRHPDAAGRAFRASGLSVVCHPRNPHVPTTHLNVRFLRVEDGPWWFGGGFDLTPYVIDPAAADHWHTTTRAACEAFGAEVYPELSQACDAYFYLPHRGEPRGIGGCFGEDLDAASFNLGSPERVADLIAAIGEALRPAYLPIVRAAKDRPWSAADCEFQLVRRGRYAEFNLAFDRGTHFGLQSGGRTESILSSMPPRAIWRYDWHPPREHELLEWVRVAGRGRNAG